MPVLPIMPDTESITYVESVSFEYDPHRADQVFPPANFAPGRMVPAPTGICGAGVVYPIYCHTLSTFHPALIGLSPPPKRRFGVYFIQHIPPIDP
jgi:hypothetical protein